MADIVRLDVRMREEEAFVVYAILEESYREFSKVLDGKANIEEADKLDSETIKLAAKGIERIINELELVLEV